jgi:hypothetical protein
MADPKPMPTGPDDEGLEFELVEGESESSGPLRNCLVTIEVTGLTTCNAGASTLVDRLVGARPGDDIKMVRFGVDKVRKTIAVYLATEKDKRKTTIRRSGEKRKTVSFHLRDVWEQYPELRPTRRTECKAMSIVDKKGVPCVILTLGAGWEKRRGKKGQSNDQSGDQGGAQSGGQGSAQSGGRGGAQASGQRTQSGGSGAQSGGQPAPGQGTGANPTARPDENKPNPASDPKENPAS